MSLDKAIEHGKEHRKPYRNSGAFDRSCRPNGGCPYCESSRLRYRIIDRELVDAEMKYFYEMEYRLFYGMYVSKDIYEQD